MIYVAREIAEKKSTILAESPVGKLIQPLIIRL
jgi:hypothetical protein